MIHASKISSTTMKEQIEILVEGISEIEKAVSFLSDLKSQTEEEKTFISSMKHFLKSNSERVSNTQKNFLKMISKFEETVKFFAEDPKEKKSPDQFFNPILQFVDSFQLANIQAQKNAQKKMDSKLSEKRSGSKWRERCLMRQNINPNNTLFPNNDINFNQLSPRSTSSPATNTSNPSSPLGSPRNSSTHSTSHTPFSGSSQLNPTSIPGLDSGKKDKEHKDKNKGLSNSQGIFSKFLHKKEKKDN